ncbi:15198_t:CDS:1, partial [Funneliformis caledonium]
MESAGNPDKQEENVNEKTDSGQFDNNRLPSKDQTSNYSSAKNENSLEQSS